MATLSRWMKYAKARLDAALGSGNRELDRLEAEREAELADKPWLRDDADAPSLDIARARIEHELEKQRHDAGAVGGDERATGVARGPGADAAEGGPGSEARDEEAGSASGDGRSGEASDGQESDRSSGDEPSPTSGGTAGGGGAARGPALRDPADVAADAQLEQARLEIEANQREAAARLEAMRRELGVDDPPEAR